MKQVFAPQAAGAELLESFCADRYIICALCYKGVYMVKVTSHSSVALHMKSAKEAILYAKDLAFKIAQFHSPVQSTGLRRPTPAELV